MSDIMILTDKFKKTFIEGFEREITLEMMIFVLLFALAASFFIFMIYRFTVKDVPYSKGFAVTMSMISVVTAGIILAVQSSVVISLGMVGALSIVRFRTAIKNPIDLLFLFWSISIGIITGAGLYNLAIVSCIVVTMGITIYQIVPIRSAPHLLMVKMNGEDAEEKVLAVVKEKSKRFKVKTRSLRGDTEEMVIELRIVKNAGDIARVVNRINEVTEVSMLAHDGEMIAQ